MTTSKRRGRPLLAAQSAEEAWRMYAENRLPPRPRNEFEREVMRRTKGRRLDPSAPIHMAAELAHWFRQSDGISRTAAAKRAVQELANAGVHVDEANVRRYLRSKEQGPRVLVEARVAATWLAPVQAGSKTIPLLQSVEDVSLSGDGGSGEGADSAE